MPFKDKEKQKAYQREWQKRRADEASEIMRELKSKPCTDCGNIFHWSAMDFDHIDDNKVDGVAKFACRGRLDLMLIEIAKCELVCANCHRVRTWKRLNNHSDVM